MSTRRERKHQRKKEAEERWQAMSQKQRVTAIAVGAAVLGVLLLVGLMSDNDTGGSSSSEDRDLSNMAFVQCKNFVEESLKAPSTADFPFLDFTSTEEAENEYLVSSYVDAENSFGAKVRSDWTCRISYVGGDDADIASWTLVDLDIEDG
jgi:hypothetical protein